MKSKSIIRTVLALSVSLFAFGCVGDEILLTDEEISGGSESETTTQTDPELSWSASEFTATLGTDNTFPTLTNKYGVTVSYSSSTTSVATIASDGTVTLVAAGTTTITASSEETDDYEASSSAYTLTVVRSEAGLAWSAESASVTIGEEYTLPTLSNPNSLEITYSSSNESVATIASDGTVTIVAAGTTTITAAVAESTSYEAASVSYTLTVSKSSSGISWSSDSYTATIGEENSFPTLNNPGSQTIAYASSNTSVATVDSESGEITLIAAGATTITATSTETDNYDGTSVSYALTVEDKESSLKGADLSWSASELSATMGSEPDYPTLSNPNSLKVTYSSSNTDVATIDSDGYVTLVGSGTTTITATSEATEEYAAGSAYYKLTVSKVDASLSWSASSFTATMASENSFPELTNPYKLDVTYSTSDASVATIDSEGNITLVGAGTASIIAETEASDIYSACSASYTLKVVKATVTLTWSESSFKAVLEKSNSYPTLTISPEDADITIAYSSSNTSAATIDANGNVTPIATGTSTISATFDGNDTYKSASASYTLTVSGGADEGAGTYTYSSTGDTSSDDDISNTTFNRMITITYSSGSASVTGDYYGYVTTSGANVTVNNTGEEYIIYKLTGTTTSGSFTLYSSKKQAILLSGVSITNPNGAAINNQSGKRTFVVVENDNTLVDGSSAAYSTSDDEDMKGVFFSEGQLIFSGSGSLTVTAKNAEEKSCIVSDDYVRIMDSPTIKVSAGSSAGHGIRGKEYVQISDGTLSVTTTAAKKKGIGSDDYVLVEGGTTTITVSGGVAYDSDDAEYKGTAGIKADNYFAMTGGELTIKNTGAGGKGIRAGDYEYDETSHTLSDSYITGGTLTITTTGSESNDVSSKGMKIGYKEQSGNSYVYAGNLKISGGEVIVNVSKSEGLEVKGDLTFSGGSTYVYSSGDDAINCQGAITVNDGYVFGYSTQNDGMDSNGNTKLNGGYVFAITTKGSPEVAFDTNTEGGYKLYINSGATVVAYGGLENGYSASQSVYSMSCTAGSWNALYNGSSYIAAFKAPSGISSVAVSAPSLSAGYTGVSVSGTTYCNGIWATSGISGGSSTSLSTYSGGSGMGGNTGGGPGGSGGGPGGSSGWGR